MTSCEGPKRLKISWSSLQAHELCKHKAMLYREKKKAPATNIRPFFHGIVADRIMRRWLDADEQVPGQMVDWVEEMVQSCMDEARSTGDGIVQWKHSSDRLEMADWIRVLLGRLEPFLLREIVPFEYQPEYRFRVPMRIPDLSGNISEIDLVGGMDILVRESVGPPEVWAGYDLKATANPDYLRKTLGQGIFYSMAHYAMQGVPFRTFAFVQPMVEKNPIAYVDITDADLRAMLGRIVAMAHSMWRNETEPKKDSEGCSWCPVKHACAKFKPGAKTMFKPKRGGAQAA